MYTLVVELYVMVFCRLTKMQVGDNIVLLGNSKEEKLDDFTLSSLQFNTSLIPSTGMIFYRCIIHDATYFSKCYTRTKKLNNFTLAYTDNGEILLGEIEYFLCVSISQTLHVYACITCLVKQNNNRSHFDLPHNALELCKCLSVHLKL